MEYRCGSVSGMIFPKYANCYSYVFVSYLFCELVICNDVYEVCFLDEREVTSGSSCENSSGCSSS